MNILELSEIIFNFTVSIAIVAVSVLVAMIAIEILYSIRRTKKFVKDIKEESVELYRRVDIFLAGFAAMPFIAKIFKKNKKDEK